MSWLLIATALGAIAVLVPPIVFGTMRWADLLVNISSELVGVLLTVGLISTIAERQRRRERIRLAGWALYEPIVAVRSTASRMSHDLLGDKDISIERLRHWVSEWSEVKGRINESLR